VNEVGTVFFHTHQDGKTETGMRGHVFKIAIAAVLAGCGGNGGSPPDRAGQIEAGVVEHADTVAASDYQTAVQELYIAYYGRPADPAGLAFWEGALLAGHAPTSLQSLNSAYAGNAAVKSVIDSFAKSAESAALYGSGDTVPFIAAVYQHVLGRAPDQAGSDFWVNTVNTGLMTVGQAALAIVASAASQPSTSPDELLVNNRLIVANDFTAQVSAGYAASAYSGDGANLVVRTMLSAVTANTDTTSYVAKDAATIASLVATASVIHISGVSATAVAPFSALTISGSRFNQTGAAVSVRFIPLNGNPAVTVPVAQPSASTLRVMVPPLFDPASGNSIAAAVDVQVVQVWGHNVITSDPWHGVQLAALPAVRAGAAVGTVTTAFLDMTLAVFNNTQAALAADASLSQIAKVAPNYVADLNALRAAVAAVTAAPSGSASLGMANGASATLNAKALVQTDQMVQAVIAVLASETQSAALASSAQAGIAQGGQQRADAPCPLYPNDPAAYDTNLCWVQRFFQNMSSNPEVTDRMGKALINLIPGSLGVGEYISNQVLAGGLWTFGYAYLATGKAPPGGEALSGMTTAGLDTWGKTGGMIGFTFDVFDILMLAATAYPPQSGVAPVAMAVSDPSGNTYLVLRDGSTLVSMPQAQAVKPVDSLSLVREPPACSDSQTYYPNCVAVATIASAVTPGNITKGSAGTCSGGTVSATFQVAAAPGVTWNATPDASLVLGSGARVSAVPGSGSGSGSFTVTIDVPPQLPSSSYSSCSLTYKLNTFTNIYVKFSDGSNIGVTLYWSYIGVT
jgi:hypothetical protein